jgi:hypothetical protein
VLKATFARVFRKQRDIFFIVDFTAGSPVKAMSWISSDK